MMIMMGGGGGGSDWEDEINHFLIVLGGSYKTTFCQYWRVNYLAENQTEKISRVNSFFISRATNFSLNSIIHKYT